jgi:hypothetical protein
MYAVTYQTKTDTYTKRFMTQREADRFCGWLRKLYPEQRPTVELVF